MTLPWPKIFMALKWPKIFMALPWPKIFMALKWPKMFMALPWPKIFMALKWPKILLTLITLNTCALLKFLENGDKTTKVMPRSASLTLCSRLKILDLEIKI